jgi:hypothetical protein
MKNKSKGKRLKAKARTTKERTCVRCGCTWTKACPGSCSWLEAYVGVAKLKKEFTIDICTSCLTNHEENILDSVIAAEGRADAARTDADFFKTVVIDWLLSPDNPANQEANE